MGVSFSSDGVHWFGLLLGADPVYVFEAQGPWSLNFIFVVDIVRGSVPDLLKVAGVYRMSLYGRHNYSIMSSLLKKICVKRFGELLMLVHYCDGFSLFDKGVKKKCIEVYLSSSATKVYLSLVDLVVISCLGGDDISVSSATVDIAYVMVNNPPQNGIKNVFVKGRQMFDVLSHRIFETFKMLSCSLRSGLTGFLLYKCLLGIWTISVVIWKYGLQVGCREVLFMTLQGKIVADYLLADINLMLSTWYSNVLQLAMITDIMDLGSIYGHIAEKSLSKLMQVGDSHGKVLFVIFTNNDLERADMLRSHDSNDSNVELEKYVELFICGAKSWFRVLGMGLLSVEPGVVLILSGTVDVVSQGGFRTVLIHFQVGNVVLLLSGSGTIVNVPCCLLMTMFYMLVWTEGTLFGESEITVRNYRLAASLKEWIGNVANLRLIWIFPVHYGNIKVAVFDWFARVRRISIVWARFLLWNISIKRAVSGIKSTAEVGLLEHLCDNPFGFTRVDHIVFHIEALVRGGLSSRAHTEFLKRVRLVVFNVANPFRLVHLNSLYAVTNEVAKDTVKFLIMEGNLMCPLWRIPAGYVLSMRNLFLFATLVGRFVLATNGPCNSLRFALDGVQRVYGLQGFFKRLELKIVLKTHGRSRVVTSVLKEGVMLYCYGI